MPLTVHFHLKTPFLKEHLTLNWLLTFPLYDRNQKTFMNRLNGLLSAHLQPSSLDLFGHFLKRFEAFDTWISDLCHLFFWRGALVTTRLTFLMFFLSEASPFRQPSPLFHLSFPRHRGPAPQQGCFTPEVLKASQPPTQIIATDLPALSLPFSLHQLLDVTGSISSVHFKWISPLSISFLSWAT